MKLKISLFAVLLFACILSSSAHTIPRPDHIVILMMKNYGYADIVSSNDVTHINALTNDANATLFTQSYVVSHSGQPNYIN